MIITDYHSKFPFIRKVRGRCTSGSVVQITKDIFSEQGIPLKVISDNGPQFLPAKSTKLLHRSGDSNMSLPVPTILKVTDFAYRP